MKAGGTIDWDNGNVYKLTKHKLTKSDVEVFVYDHPTVFLGEVVESKDQNWGEKRFVSVGLTKEKVHLLVWTTRGNSLRPISCRRARKNEVEAYYERF